MKNLDKVAPYTSSITQGNWGTMTTLVAEVGVSAKDSIAFGEKTLLSNYVYDKNGTYKRFIRWSGLMVVLTTTPRMTAFCRHCS
ncbi:MULTISPECIES: hypothetical protein [unclassified Janthinobacterium]|uniref:hypothetical protein n=1 Tax=unclassified Janthinobacterium TaxID=2610881 RepID=UPI001C30137C|nr:MULTISPECIES: hypothetical protein [unclassified Janthinobacterium]